MKSILEELWYGNICPETDSRTTTLEMKQLMEYMARHHETLLTTLNDEQKETFEKFDDCWSEYASLAEKSIFVYAFRLGANISIDILSADYRSKQKNRNAAYTIFDVSGICHYSPGSDKTGYFR